MKCSRRNNCNLNCQGKILEGLNNLIRSEVETILKNNKLPDAAIKKINDAICSELDAAKFCELFDKNAMDNQQVRNRYLDRSICFVFETFYDEVIATLRSRGRRFRKVPDFFDTVPRGECLDTFLRVVRNHCVGNNQEQALASEIELIISKHHDGIGHVPWGDIYGLEEFHDYADRLTNILFINMLSGERPVPAIENALPAKFDSKKINNMVRLMYRIWEKDRNELIMKERKAKLTEIEFLN